MEKEEQKAKISMQTGESFSMMINRMKWDDFVLGFLSGIYISTLTVIAILIINR